MDVWIGPKISNGLVGTGYTLAETMSKPFHRKKMDFGIFQKIRHLYEGRNNMANLCY